MDHAHHTGIENDRRLLAAVSVNVLLTLAQVIGGVISGSLSLIADALHNFSDAASLGIASTCRSRAESLGLAGFCAIKFLGMSKSKSETFIIGKTYIIRCLRANMVRTILATL